MDGLLIKWKRDESGNSMVEYGLVVMLVAFAAAASVHSVGLWLVNLWNWLLYLSTFLKYG